MDNHPDYSEWTEVGVCSPPVWVNAMGGKPVWHNIPPDCIGARLRLRLDEKVVCHLRFPWGAISLSAQYRRGGNWRPGGMVYAINHRGHMVDPCTSKADIAELLRIMLAEIENAEVSHPTKED